ncbi:hypothetical protein PR048_002229 [Dryococelus australis]|uniref:Cadherin domain-containing protein n=1 Tax=Dryococelus australis TaxID=614101 RepID=A0ABQ9IJM0_9NEOP|nr:hypothetical protein PR048_002229 [Dryococelus australis]
MLLSPAALLQRFVMARRRVVDAGLFSLTHSRLLEWSGACTKFKDRLQSREGILETVEIQRLPPTDSREGRPHPPLLLLAIQSPCIMSDRHEQRAGACINNCRPVTAVEEKNKCLVSTLPPNGFAKYSWLYLYFAKLKSHIDLQEVGALSANHRPPGNTLTSLCVCIYSVTQRGDGVPRSGVERGEDGATPECQRGGNGTSSRKNPPISSIIRCDSHIRKSGSEQSNHYTTVAPRGFEPGVASDWLPRAAEGSLLAALPGWPVTPFCQHVFRGQAIMSKEALTSLDVTALLAATSARWKSRELLLFLLARPAMRARRARLISTENVCFRERKKKQQISNTEEGECVVMKLAQWNVGGEMKTKYSKMEAQPGTHGTGKHSAPVPGPILTLHRAGPGPCLCVPGLIQYFILRDCRKDFRNALSALRWFAVALPNYILLSPGCDPGSTWRNSRAPQQNGATDQLNAGMSFTNRHLVTYSSPTGSLANREPSAAGLVFYDRGTLTSKEAAAISSLCVNPADSSSDLRFYQCSVQHCQPEDHQFRNSATNNKATLVAGTSSRPRGMKAPQEDLSGPLQGPPPSLVKTRDYGRPVAAAQESHETGEPNDTLSHPSGNNAVRASLLLRFMGRVTAYRSPSSTESALLVLDAHLQISLNNAGRRSGNISNHITYIVWALDWIVFAWNAIAAIVCKLDGTANHDNTHHQQQVASLRVDESAGTTCCTTDVESFHFPGRSGPALAELPSPKLQSGDWKDGDHVTSCRHRKLLLGNNVMRLKVCCTASEHQNTIKLTGGKTERAAPFVSVSRWSILEVELEHGFSKVTDTNDNPPVFSEAAYSFDIVENTVRGAKVGEVVAKDDDQGVNGHVTYSVISDWANDVFSLNPQSGVFTLTARLDYEEAVCSGHCGKAIPCTGSLSDGSRGYGEKDFLLMLCERSQQTECKKYPTGLRISITNENNLDTKLARLFPLQSEQGRPFNGRRPTPLKLSRLTNTVDGDVVCQESVVHRQVQFLSQLLTPATLSSNMSFANQRLVCYLSAGSSAYRKTSTARGNQSDARSVPRASGSQLVEPRIMRQTRRECGCSETHTRLNCIELLHIVWSRSRFHITTQEAVAKEFSILHQTRQPL